MTLGSFPVTTSTIGSHSQSPRHPVCLTTMSLRFSSFMTLRIAVMVIPAPAAILQVPMPTVILPRASVICAFCLSRASSFRRFKSSSDLTSGILVPPAADKLMLHNNLFLRVVGRCNARTLSPINSLADRPLTCETLSQCRSSAVLQGTSLRSLRAQIQSRFPGREFCHELFYHTWLDWSYDKCHLKLRRLSIFTLIELFPYSTIRRKISEIHRQ